MRADWPPWLGKRAFRTSAACWDSTPGTRWLLSNLPPAPACSPTTATAATSQTPITMNGCRALLRPRRYRNALTRSSWSRARSLRDDPTIQERADLAPRCALKSLFRVCARGLAYPAGTTGSTDRPRSKAAENAVAPRAAVAASRARSTSSRWKAGTSTPASARSRSACPSRVAACSAIVGLRRRWRRARRNTRRRRCAGRRRDRRGCGTAEGRRPDRSPSPRRPRGGGLAVAPVDPVQRGRGRRGRRR